MFIQTAKTPNPHVMKFLPGCEVSPTRAVGYSDVLAASGSPLAQRLFAIAGVEAVFLGADFVSVTRHPSKDWDSLKPLVLGALMDHFMSGASVVERFDDDALHRQDDALAVKIRAVLDEHVRPMVARDGGDIVFERFEDGVVYIYMRGACAGCPAANMTLKMGVERLLREHVAEVQEVRAVQD